MAVLATVTALIASPICSIWWSDFLNILSQPATYFLSDRTLTTSLLFHFLPFVCTHSCLFLPQIICHGCKVQQKQMTNKFITLSFKPIIYVLDRIELDGGPSEVINVIYWMFYQVIPGFMFSDYALWQKQRRCCFAFKRNVAPWQKAVLQWLLPTVQSTRWLDKKYLLLYFYRFHYLVKTVFKTLSTLSTLSKLSTFSHCQHWQS